MSTNEIVTFLVALLPAIITVIGGQAVLIRYRKSKEQEIELIRAVRERQYEAVQSLYTLFGRYMALYREINRSDVKNPQVREELMKLVIQSESEVDALLLKIACEFAEGPVEKLEHILGHLRQSVQFWREQLDKGEQLPFIYASTYEYVRFKETFAETAAFMVHHIHQKLEPSKMQQKQAADLLIRVFNYLNVADKWQTKQMFATPPYKLPADSPTQDTPTVNLVNRTERGKTYVTINDVNVVQREVMQTGQFHFDWLWDQLSPEERMVLSALAEGGKEEGRWLTLVEIEEVYRRNRIPINRKYLLNPLNALIDADLIESISSDSRDSALENSRFRIPAGLTREWLLKERSLEVVSKEMSNTRYYERENKGRSRRKRYWNQ